MIDVLKGEGTVRKEFPGKWILFHRYGIDITKEPMLVYPTLHYQNGGLEINSRTETVVPGLYAAGRGQRRRPRREPPDGQFPARRRRLRPDRRVQPRPSTPRRPPRTAP